MNKLIADNPPNDGRDWDCQCARCGSSCVSETCDTCGGTGVNDWGEDDWDYGGPQACDICEGGGGWMHCCSSLDWCEAHPIEGRENTGRGAIEWFAFDDEPQADDAVGQR
jgi:hypothetical protein